MRSARSHPPASLMTTPRSRGCAAPRGSRAASVERYDLFAGRGAPDARCGRRAAAHHFFGAGAADRVGRTIGNLAVEGLARSRHSCCSRRSGAGRRSPGGGRRASARGQIGSPPITSTFRQLAIWRDDLERRAAGASRRSRGSRRRSVRCGIGERVAEASEPIATVGQPSIAAATSALESSTRLRPRSSTASSAHPSPATPRRSRSSARGTHRPSASPPRVPARAGAPPRRETDPAPRAPRPPPGCPARTKTGTRPVRREIDQEHRGVEAAGAENAHRAAHRRRRLARAGEQSRRTKPDAPIRSCAW